MLLTSLPRRTSNGSRPVALCPPSRALAAHVEHHVADPLERRAAGVPGVEQLWSALIGTAARRDAQAALLHADLCGAGGPLDEELFTALVLPRAQGGGGGGGGGGGAADVADAFALFDADGDGAVSAADLDDVLRRVRVKPPHVAALSCLTEGRLSGADFAALLARGPLHPPRR